MNFDSYSLKNSQKLINISELVYDLRNHPELINEKRLDDLSGDIKKLTRKSLKHYIIKKIKNKIPDYNFKREDFTDQSDSECICDS
jgi:Fe-S cluster biosynthesis and repair protein YggX